MEQEKLDSFDQEQSFLGIINGIFLSIPFWILLYFLIYS